MFTDSPDVDAIREAVEPLGRQAQEVAMTFGERMIAQGEARGVVLSLARMKRQILDVLERRAISVSADDRQRIAECGDFETALTWFERSTTVNRASDVFDD